MAEVAAVAAVIGLGVNVATTAKSNRLQKEKGEVVSATQRSEDASRLRVQARQARVERARILQVSETAGGGSREGGGIASLSTQLSANQARVSGQQQAAQVIGSINQDIAQTQVTKAVGQVVQSVGSFAFAEAGGFDNLFKGS